MKKPHPAVPLLHRIILYNPTRSSRVTTHRRPRNQTKEDDSYSSHSSMCAYAK